MANYRLREALQAAGMTPETVAVDLDVDPKTVERWVTQNRVPYPRHRARLAASLGASEEHLWPNVTLEQEQDEEDEVEEAVAVELANVYPHRSSVPPELWRRLLGRATQRISVLAYAGLFLYEQQPQIVKVLRHKAEAGVQVRLLLGDPTSMAARARDEESGGADDLMGKMRRAQAHFRPLATHSGITIRLHRTTLYNSIYRFDDEMLVHSHLYGLPAAHAPVVHLRQVPFGELFELYLRSFEHIWQDAELADVV
ncbi:MAG: XRE family transcriptional regulator [Acidimicrobiales bacterium]